MSNDKKKDIQIPPLEYIEKSYVRDSVDHSDISEDLKAAYQQKMQDLESKRDSNKDD